MSQRTVTPLSQVCDKTLDQVLVLWLTCFFVPIGSSNMAKQSLLLGFEHRAKHAFFLHFANTFFKAQSRQQVSYSRTLFFSAGGGKQRDKKKKEPRM